VISSSPSRCHVIMALNSCPGACDFRELLHVQGKPARGVKINDRFVVSHICAQSGFALEIETEQCAELVGWEAEGLLKASLTRLTTFVRDSARRKRLQLPNHGPTKIG
jgi:hypothetical protein